ncbi:MULTISPECIES: pentapeptide repeat-containing protein [Pseudanabaena]|jgi:uncharacterized protein YjbI with pentapeptide repeats|uniref:pentapeptide repeat-containing protein n=1 Tax=Pseudanabaena TaxID=1152 RepID=UPI00247A31C6|nr:MULTISPECIES: pentapeptide repeat-containing protein [Pseudanabaena]MEA5489972.1 pentapeptide repeat-containing protein [Pseudanabaena sp. CCNP1317]WGS74992.1 pentapeptide repeat-containing protein [Pseudanabaena galeata CCNP1313]
MSKLSRLFPFLENFNLKTSTPKEPPSKQRLWLGKFVWIVIIIAIVGIGGRFLFFKVESNPFQLPMTAYDWTGFGESYDQDVLTVTETAKETPSNKQTIKTTKTTNRLQPAKTLWDLMSLLLAPATLAGLGFWFQSSQEKAKRDKEDADKKRELARQQEQAKRDAEQQREQALQSYYDQLSVLLVDKKLGAVLLYQLNTSTDDIDNVSELEVGDTKQAEIDADAALNVVKAKTLSLFRAFEQDMPRKSSVLSFLGDSGLLIHLKLDLSSSNWKEANLSNAQLSGVNFSGANFSKAQLFGANLRGANLSMTNFKKAKLSLANLSKTDLSDANLNKAQLDVANLSDAQLIGTQLIGAELIGCDLMRANLSDANLSDAYLSGAFLKGANFSKANLSGANLSRAFLNGAKFSKANLSGADLSYADLSDVDLIGAIIDIQQIKSAKGWESALFSDTVRAELDKSISQKQINQ